MQASGLNKFIPFTCTSAIWGQSCFLAHLASCRLKRLSSSSSIKTVILASMAASRVKWKPGLWNNQQYDAPLSGGISLPHGDGAIPWNIGKGPGDVAWVTASGTTLVLIRCFCFFFFWEWILFLKKHQELNYWMMRLEVLTECDGEVWIVDWPWMQLWQKSFREVMSKHSVFGIGFG